MEYVAITFNNRLGNFIFMTSAVKILRSWGYKKIDLISDASFLNTPAAELAADVFDKIVVSVDGPKEIHDKIRGKGAYKKTINNFT